MKIKSTILLISIMGFSLTSVGQTWISAYYYNYIKISVEYTYKATPINSFGISDALATKTTQYDQTFDEVKATYDQMVALQLLNKLNRNYLNSYRDKYFKQIATQASKIDLSIPSNSDWVINNLRIPVTSNKNVRNEIKIMNLIGKEVDFLEHSAYLFKKEQIGDIDQKKKNINGFLAEYENSDPSLANQLISKYDLNLLMLGQSLE